MDITGIISNIPWLVGYAIITGITAIIVNHLVGPWIKDWVSNRKKKKKDEDGYTSQIKKRIKELVDILGKCHYYPVKHSSEMVLQRPDANLKSLQKLDEKIDDINRIMTTYRTLFMYALILIEKELQDFVVSDRNYRLYDEFLKKQDDVTPLKGMINFTLDFPSNLTRGIIPLIFSEKEIDDSSLRTINIKHKQYLDVLLNNDDARSRLITKLRELKKSIKGVNVFFGPSTQMELLPFKELEYKRVELIKHLVELEKLL